MASSGTRSGCPANESSRIERRGGTICGPLRASRNTALDLKGSIHDDTTAVPLGFRGGTVAGSVHLELFPPLLIEAFGPRWFEHGTVSVYFRNATVDQELVRAFVELPPSGSPDAQVAVRIEREDGLLAGDGTASVGDPDNRTALGQRDLQPFPPGGLRILAGVAAGDRLGEHEMCVTAAQQQERLPVITEPLDWYWGASPWGGPVLTPYTEVSLLYPGPALAFGSRLRESVVLFGAIELRHFDGPLLVDATYHVTGRVLAVGQSPKTEYVWFDSEAREAGGRLVGGMRMQLRWMKASSALYRTDD